MTREGHSREASLLLERLTHAGGLVVSSMQIWTLSVAFRGAVFGFVCLEGPCRLSFYWPWHGDDCILDLYLWWLVGVDFVSVHVTEFWSCRISDSDSLQQHGYGCD